MNELATYWHYFIAAVTVLSVLGYLWLLAEQAGTAPAGDRRESMAGKAGTAATRKETRA